MSVTIRDIAKLAGVSHTTVSRVLNNNPNVKLETREKITKIMKEIQFSPHFSARSLGSGRTNTIGLLVLYDFSQFPADFLPKILIGMANKLNEYGYNLTLYFNQAEGKKDQASLPRLNKNNMDGVFLLSTEAGAETELAYIAARIDLPMVLVNQKVDEIDLNYIAADDEGGAFAAVSHLIEAGNRAIALIGGTPKYKTSQDRQAGYRRALREHGVAYRPELVKTGYFNRDKSYTCMMELLNEAKDISAVFCANDIMALGAMKAIREKRLKIPEDIAVAGFDDAEFAEAVDPPLTTVKKSRMEMGSRAAEMMLGILNADSRKPAEKLVLPTSLIIRKSSSR